MLKKGETYHHIKHVRCVTFRSLGSKALGAYNQYYIFHCHLHSYCKWLVSKIITGCIRNLGFAILLFVLGGPFFALHHLMLMVPQWQKVLAPHLPFLIFLPFLTSFHVTVVWNVQRISTCKRKCLLLKIISPLCRFQLSASRIVLLAGRERLNLVSLLLS